VVCFFYASYIEEISNIVEACVRLTHIHTWLEVCMTSIAALRVAAVEATLLQPYF
jgi:hypothetical protein